MPESWELFRSITMYACWGAFAVAWIVGAVVNVRRAPAVLRRGPWWSPAVIVVVAVLALRLLVPEPVWRTLSYRSPWLGVLGAVLLLGATAFTLWARWRLGTMWTSSAVVKLGHQLRTDGPYRVTRHPIYTGLLGMVLGTTLVAGLGVWLVAPVLGVVLVEVKLRAEERLLSAEFPEDYAEFRRQVPRLVPFARLARPVPGARSGG